MFKYKVFSMAKGIKSRSKSKDTNNKSTFIDLSLLRVVVGAPCWAFLSQVALVKLATSSHLLLLIVMLLLLRHHVFLFWIQALSFHIIFLC
jgi:hypothetical protein